MRPKKSIVLQSITALFVLLLAALSGGCGSSGAHDAVAKEIAPEAAIPVQVAPVRRETIAANYSGTATLETDGEAEVAAKTGGVVIRLHVEEGDRVAKGQLLAQLDDEGARAALDQATATLKKFEARFERAERAIKTNLIPRTSTIRTSSTSRHSVRRSPRHDCSCPIRGSWRRSPAWSPGAKSSWAT
jgi:membrane fusion protein (multidrug efflux system)